MKRLRKVLSLLLVGVIAVTSLFCGTVTASADGVYRDAKVKVVKTDEYVGFLFLNDYAINEDYDKLYKSGKDVSLYVPVHILNYWCVFFGNVKDGNIYYNVVDDDDKHIQPDFFNNIIDEDNMHVVAYLWKKDSKVGKELLKNDGMISWNRPYYWFVTDEGLVWGSTSEGHAGIIFMEDLSNKYSEALGLSVSSTSSNSTEKSTKKSISDLAISSISSKTYTGKALKPDVTVKDGTKKLTKDKDYTLTYKNNTKIGKATVTIKGKGNYSGTKTLNFNIIPAKTTLTTKKSSSGYTLSWKKISGIDKYQIQYSTDGGKTYKSAGTAASGKTSKTIRLDTSKSYTFRIRSYKVVDGKKYYSSWSKTVKA